MSAAMKTNVADVHMSGREPWCALDKITLQCTQQHTLHEKLLLVVYHGQYVGSKAGPAAGWTARVRVCILIVPANRRPAIRPSYLKYAHVDVESAWKHQETFPHTDSASRRSAVSCHGLCTGMIAGVCSSTDIWCWYYTNSRSKR